uniref:Uncharacterized protein n=1 Tax=Neogobius melanostomus TaxID=47308 RepID=A0A8C6TCF6_9GOBI
MIHRVQSTSETRYRDSARKSEWLRSALAHYHRPDLAVDNEIVVLATGIDQYLQEVFHHLAYPNRDDTVSAEDFTSLCAVLGLSERSRTGEDDEFMDVCSELPAKLPFKDFHARLCSFFRVRSARKGSGGCAWRLPVTEDTELVEKHIRLRWPRARRKKCVSFDLTHETAALRELVEDLRAALQSSDARCLALEVALRKERTSSLPSPNIKPKTSAPSSISFIQGKLVPTQRIKGGFRRRAEEAREALTVGLERVRLIQEQAQSVPELHAQVRQLKTELQHHR